MKLQKIIVVCGKARKILFQIVFLFCLNTLAQEYGFDVWTTENGLPQNTVTGVAQTPDGYLWLATFDGLARFADSERVCAVTEVQSYAFMRNSELCRIESNLVLYENTKI